MGNSGQDTALELADVDPCNAAAVVFGKGELNVEPAVFMLLDDAAV
jgi:hypothetical protein